MSKELKEAQDEISYLKECLSYLADCNLSTYEIALHLKRFPKSRRDRLENICKISLKMLEGDWKKPYSAAPVDSVVESIKDLKESLG